MARHHKQWTQADLERFSGVRQGTISKIERGGQGYSTFDVDLAYALDINPMWLKTGRAEFEPDWLQIQGVEKDNQKKH